MRLPLSRVTLAAFVVGAALGFATCSVNLGDKYTYRCATDGDCAGDSFKCAVSGGKGVCCLPSGPEVCDGIDNDCDGKIDNTGKAEICNGADDDCNGKVDDGYNLKTDPSNCGACGHVCTSKEVCTMSACVKVTEFNCFDGLDNDENGKIDCADSSCELRACAASCVGCACTCHDLKKSEADCTNRKDDDGDLAADCLDSDCLGKSCATGCTCVADGGMTETGCDDGVDNDGDAKIDCLDPDCLNKNCTPPPIFFACTSAQLCKCNGSVQVAEVGSVLCRDGIDNDCNGKVDCAESSCDGQPCLADGGTGCACAAGGKKEIDCANLVDDDGDGLIDCADSDCPTGIACLKAAGGTGMCSATKNCE